MTDTAELKPVAWRARRYGSSEWEVFGYDPRALKQFSFFEPLYSADALTSPASEVEQIIAASTRMAKRLGVAFEVNPAKVEQFIRGTSPASGPVQPRSEAELEALPAHPLAAWRTGLALGLHRVHWESGGSSLCAVGMQSDGRRWIAPCNWLAPSLDPESDSWAEIERTELLFAYPEPSPASGDKHKPATDTLDKAAIRLYNYVGVTLRAHGPNPKPWVEQPYEHQLKWRDAVRIVLDNAPSVSASTASGERDAVIEVADAMVEDGAVAIDALWSEGQDRGPAFAETEREYQAHCRSTARAAITAALRMEGK